MKLKVSFFKNKSFGWRKLSPMITHSPGQQKDLSIERQRAPSVTPRLVDAPELKGINRLQRHRSMQDIKRADGVCSPIKIVLPETNKPSLFANYHFELKEKVVA